MAADSRRCTASQFFMDEEQQANESVPTYERVVELLNQASLLQKDSQKINKLKLVQELIINKEPDLLDNFLDEMLAFQSDRSADVKKFVIGFMEEACKKDYDLLPKVIGNMILLLQDENVQVKKKVILSMTSLYKVALRWVCQAKIVSSEMSEMWTFVVQVRDKLMEMIESENDGIRTHVVKFIESQVLTLSAKTEESEVPKKHDVDMSLDKVPENHSLIKYKKMEEEGKKSFETLLEFMGSSYISSANLITCMSSLTTIAKQRPQFLPKVVQGFEALHVNLPPTLAKSQVSSVRKNLKMQLLALLRHTASVEFHGPITTLLTDLGATQSEVLKCLPKVDESKKRKAEESGQPFKKPKMEKEQPIVIEADDDYGMTPFVGLGASSATKPKATEAQQQSAIDITAEDLAPRLTPQNVADLVLLSMVMLPDAMPPQFQATYTPIAAAGTQAQIKHLSRLLATQLTAAGLGKGVHSVNQPEGVKDDADDVEPGTSPKHSIMTVVGGSVDLLEKEGEGKGLIAVPKMVPPPVPAAATGPTRGVKGIKQFKLSTVTKPLDGNSMDTLAAEAINRILQADKIAQLGNASAARIKVLTRLVSQFGGMFKESLQNYIFADLRNRADIALAWIYQEYCNYQGFNLATSGMQKPTIASYDECLTRLLNGLLERPDKREGLFSRLILEAPCITPNAIMVLRKYCQDSSRVYLGMTTLKELILKRPSKKLEFLDVLLEFASHEKADVRNNAIRVTKKLHERDDLEEPIEKYALYNLKLLLRPRPPQELMGSNRGRFEQTEMWTEEMIKLCLYLYLGLLPVKHKLIHELANVYTATSADIKRTILRVLENPVKGMGMSSPELLLLVENCPKGAETLVTRIIHILTDKTAPTPELVERVRDLYHKRVSDVRFLIPILTGLSKEEVIAALPKLIKLNPVVVKEVFNRLLGGHSSGDTTYSSALSPADLLIALHNIDPNKCDMKTIIKATNLCFVERLVYTQEVLALVMQQLMDQNPIPTLLMRTVIQSLSMYPKLLGLVMNIMQRLITKQVWKQKKVWEGFVKCCQRTKPQSFQVLLQLPAPQLKNVFEMSPDLQEPLLTHVQAFTPHQRAHIPKSIMNVLEKDPFEEQKAAEKARKEEEERIANQERLYQEKLEMERKKQAEKMKQRLEEEKQERLKAEQKAAELKAAEQRTAEARAAELRAEERMAAEKRAAEKKAAEKLAAEKRAAEKKAAEKKAAEKRAAEMRAAEAKAAETRAADIKVKEEFKGTSIKEEGSSLRESPGRETVKLRETSHSPSRSADVRGKREATPQREKQDRASPRTRKQVQSKKPPRQVEVEVKEEEEPMDTSEVASVAAVAMEEPAGEAMETQVSAKDSPVAEAQPIESIPTSTSGRTRRGRGRAKTSPAPTTRTTRSRKT